MKLEYIIKSILRKICIIFNKYVIYNKTVDDIYILNILNKENNELKNKIKSEFISNINPCKKCYDYISDDNIIVDARNPKEYNYSHIPGSVNIYFKEIKKKVIYPKESTIYNIFIKNGINIETPLIIYCGAGLRSSIFARELYKKGFKNVKVLEGGLYEWIHKENIICNNNNYKVIPHKKFTPIIIDSDKTK